jgi:type IV fimbrial biogenesis protein FimT
LVTLAIAAIVMSIAVPSFATFIQNNRKTTNINDLVIALNFARAEATTRQQNITVCKSDDGSTCSTGDGSGDWSQGWIVFADANNNGERQAAEEIIRVAGPLTGMTSFIGNNNVVNRVTFTPLGMTTTPGTITLCDSRGVNHAAATVIAFSGRIRLATDTNNNGIVDDGDNPVSDVTCPA